MVRVLSISTLFPSAERPGFGRFVARQFDALAERGDIDLTVINPIAKPLLAGGGCPDPSYAFPVHHLPFATIPMLGARWNPALIARAASPLVHRLHAEKPFDLIDAQFFFPDGPAAARVAKALNLPLSIKARGSDIHFWGTRRFARDAMLAAGRQAGGLLTVSEALRSDMIGLGMPASKIAVHYTGLDHAIYRPTQRDQARKALAIPTDGALLATIGNLIPLKGQALVIEALGQLPTTHLAIAGNGPDAAKLRTLAAKRGLTDRVHFLGSIAPEAIARLLSAADAMVLPSEREGLANVWIEALACGTPLVITDVGGAREVVTSPSAGRFVDRTPQAIVAGIRDLIANPSSQAEVSAHAARYSWVANAAQLAAHYRGLADAWRASFS